MRHVSGVIVIANLCVSRTPISLFSSNWGFFGLVKKINNNEFVKTPVENKEKGFEKVLNNNKLEMKIIAYRHLMEFKKYMEAVN
jgi:hypothetical protein